MFQRIDMTAWSRKEYFQHYYHSIPCSYSMTTNIDITGLKRTLAEAKASFAPAMIYLLAAEVNRHEEFRTSMDEDERVGVFDVMHPSYAVFHKETETFSCLWTQFDSDYRTFLQTMITIFSNTGECRELRLSPICRTMCSTFPISHGQAFPGLISICRKALPTCCRFLPWGNISVRATNFFFRFPYRYIMRCATASTCADF